MGNIIYTARMQKASTDAINATDPGPAQELVSYSLIADRDVAARPF